MRTVTIGCVVAAVDIAIERTRAGGRVLSASVVMHRISANTRVTITSRVKIQCFKTKSGVRDAAAQEEKR